MDPGTITLNGGFDGSSDTEILASGSSSLFVGGTAHIRFVVNVTTVTDVGFGCGVYSNQVTASAEGGTVSDLSDSGTDPDPNGNGDPAESGENDPTTFTVAVTGPIADLSITKSDSADPLNAGGAFSYSLDVSNAGPSTATSISVSDHLPAGFGFVSASGTGWNCGESGGIVTCTRASLGVGAAPSITINVTAPGSAGNITNTASVSAAEIDCNPANNSNSESTAITVPPGFAKAFSPDIIGEGGVSTLTFTIDNTANPAAATFLDFTDNLPAAVTVAMPANPYTTCIGGTLTAQAGTSVISYSGGTVAAGASCTVRVDVASSTPGMHLNSTGDLTSSLGNSGMATDALHVNAIIYVDQDAMGMANGLSWTDAFTDLQAALAIAQSGDEIWVAEGVYKPTAGADRTISFVMKNGVAIYGGFPNTGDPTFADRDWASYETILSGDLLGDDGPNYANRSDNSYHVIYNNGLDNSAVLDGFTITGGNADASSFPGQSGGGMHNSSSSPLVKNCTFSGNSADSRGGGMYNTSSSPSLTNCAFNQNAANTGGGISNNSGSLVNLTDCIFIQNSATGGYGGAVQNTESSPGAAVNCVFTGNTAAFGGAVSTGSSSQLTNCTFQGNTASGLGGGLYSTINSSPVVTNCIFWQNTGTGKSMFNDPGAPQVSHTLLEENGCPPGAACGAGVIFGQDPLFIDPANGDLRLQACSPAVDAGDNSANTTTADLAGNPRVVDAAGAAVIDMG
ncbi:MAG: DUF11 domain-containing protein, partial [Phaeodactylibacter sp.]|nr:DUF11 domain-containing protein [Phaeodactylibacter sp.]